MPDDDVGRAQRRPRHLRRTGGGARGPVAAGAPPRALRSRALIYRALYGAVLTRIDAERVHRAAGAGLAALDRIPGATALLARRLAPRDPILAVRALGLELPGPLGLAAGFDKDAAWVDPLLALGFGFVEVGTVTPRPQDGNPRPRLFRLTRDRALVNRMGFNNAGAEAAARRLAARRGRPGVVGANVGKNRDTPVEDAAGDYRAAAARLADDAAYLVINVSSPNTPGLRDLQAAASLTPLVEAVREAGAGRHVPLLVKIAPDLSDEAVDEVADLALALGLDGIVATNTTVSRAGLRSRAADVAAVGDGGLSGEPLGERSLEVLRRLRARVGDRVVLISVGGVSGGDDVWRRMLAGATLVQAYSGFVYGGPLWAWRVHRRVAVLARRYGLTSIQQAIGASADARLAHTLPGKPAKSGHFAP